MSEAVTPEATGFDALKGMGTPQEEAIVREPKIDAQGRAYATGKRKNAIARVWIKPGAGKITVNGKEFNAFFARPVLQMILQQPIVAAARKDQYDVVATVSGGGLSGQAGAVRHGISQALTHYEPELRAVLNRLHFAVAKLRMESGDTLALKRRITNLDMASAVTHVLRAQILRQPKAAVTAHTKLSRGLLLRFPPRKPTG